MRIHDPIIVVGCNRSGTTLLFRTLSSHPKLWSLYDEAQDVFYRHYPIGAVAGDRIAEPDDVVGDRISAELFRRAHNKEFFKDTPVLRLLPLKALQRSVGRLYKPESIRLVEKTPASCFRIAFLASLFPDARFVFLVRRGEAVVSSLMEGWKLWSGVGDGEWRFGKWHYIVPPGWREMVDESLQEICAFQWTTSNLAAWEDLNHYCPDRYILVRHEDALEDPQTTYGRISQFCGLPTSPYLERIVASQGRRLFTTGGSKPEPGKWLRLHSAEIDSVQHILKPVNDLFYPDSDPRAAS